MDDSQIKELIEGHIECAEVRVVVDGSNCQLVVVSDAFDGLSAVKKQQLVYGCLNPHIASGEIHAVTMETFTPAEWDKTKMFR